MPNSLPALVENAGEDQMQARDAGTGDPVFCDR